MMIMPSRLQELNQALDGFHSTHHYLIARVGSGLGVAGLGNDLGPFYLISWLSQFTHGSVEQLFTVVIGFFVTLGLLGFLWSRWRWLKNGRLRVYVIIQLVILLATVIIVGDVYALALGIILGLLPVVERLFASSVNNWRTWLLWGGIGVLIGLANNFRAETGTIVLLFVLAQLLFLSKKSPRLRWQIAGAVLGGMLIFSGLFNLALSSRDHYLAEHSSGQVQTINAHPLWHTAYIGFGYLTNDLGIRYQDEVGIAKVKATNPSVAFLSPPYEQILRQATLKLVRTNPLFAVMTVFSKLGVILLLILPFFANVGLWQAWRRRIGGPTFYPYYIALFWAAVPGIVAVPDLRYLTAFAAVAGLYGLKVAAVLTKTDSP